MDEKWQAVQIINEAVTKQMQVNSDVAQLYVLYGAIALALITFTLPQVLAGLKEQSYSKCFNVFLFGGIGFLLVAAMIFFWLSRSLTMTNNEYPGILGRFVEDDHNISWLLDSLKTVQANVTEPFCDLSPKRAQGVAAVLRHSAKFFGATGLLSYAIALIWYVKKLYVNS